MDVIYRIGYRVEHGGQGNPFEEVLVEIDHPVDKGVCRVQHGVGYGGERAYPVQTDLAQTVVRHCDNFGDERIQIGRLVCVYVIIFVAVGVVLVIFGVIVFEPEHFEDFINIRGGNHVADPENRAEQYYQCK